MGRAALIVFSSVKNFGALQFKQSHDVIGRSVLVDGNQKVVIGVLPRNFRLVSSGIGVWTLLDSSSPPFTNFVERIGAVALMKPESDGGASGI